MKTSVGVGAAICCRKSAILILSSVQSGDVAGDLISRRRVADGRKLVGRGTPIDGLRDTGNRAQHVSREQGSGRAAHAVEARGHGAVVATDFVAHTPAGAFSLDRATQLSSNGPVAP